MRPAFGALVLAIFLYGGFYPQPYLAEVLRDVPIAVVDLDGTNTSRNFARRVDASSDVSIVASLPDQPSAERLVYTRAISGILVIPKNFERDLLHDRVSPVALYSDASYFLIYQRVSSVVAAVARTVGAEVETARLISSGVSPELAAAAPAPLPLTAVALFNPQGGYATYILPAAFVLILQQTLLMGVALLRTIANPSLDVLPMDSVGPVARVAGRLAAYVVVATFSCILYLIILPYFYGVPRLGDLRTILAFALPFVLAASSLGMIIARLVRKPLAVQLLAAAVGMPFLFLSGFSWPAEALPEWLRTVAVLLPSTSAIPGLVDVGQLGATLHEVRVSFITLWLLALVYSVVAIALERDPKKSAPTAFAGRRSKLDSA